jgi:hypothetical protein
MLIGMVHCDITSIELKNPANNGSATTSQSYGRVLNQTAYEEQELLPLVPLVLITIIVGTVSNKMTKGLFGWAVAVKKVAVGCELWKKLL